MNCHQIIKHQVLHDRVEKLSSTSQFFAGGKEYIVIDSVLHFQYCHICREVSQSSSLEICHDLESYISFVDECVIFVPVALQSSSILV